MYKITTIGPGNELQIPDDLDALSAFESKRATAIIITAKEDDAALRFIIGFCEKIASGQVNSLTITKDDNHDDKTNC